MAATNELILYQISVDGPGPELDLLSCAPHGWKPLLELRLLDLPFTPKRVTLVQLRDDMPKVFGPERVTVPILIVKGADGSERTIKDSFDIACWLEDTCAAPAGKSIFAASDSPSRADVEAGKSFARFLEYWSSQHLAVNMSPCVMHTSYQIMPVNEYSEQSRKHYMDNHFAKEGVPVDPKALRNYTYKQACDWNADPEWFATHCALVRKDLSLVHRTLEDRAKRGEPGPFLMGAKPTHADFAVFCWYPYAATNPRFVDETWKHPEIAYVGKWLQALFGSGLVSDSEFMHI